MSIIHDQSRSRVTNETRAREPFTCVPNELLDQLAGDGDLTLCETRFMLRILRNTIGWRGRLRVRYSLSRLADLTGMKSRTSIYTAANALVDKGLLERHGTTRSGTLWSLGPAIQVFCVEGPKDENVLKTSRLGYQPGEQSVQSTDTEGISQENSKRAPGYQSTEPIERKDLRETTSHPPLTPRAQGTNPRAVGTNPRAKETNPRALGTNPRAQESNPRAQVAHQGERDEPTKIKIDQLDAPDFVGDRTRRAHDRRPNTTT